MTMTRTRKQRLEDVAVAMAGGRNWVATIIYTRDGNVRSKVMEFRVVNFAPYPLAVFILRRVGGPALMRAGGVDYVKDYDADKGNHMVVPIAHFPVYSRPIGTAPREGLVDMVVFTPLKLPS